MKSPRGGTSVLKRCNLGGKGEIAAEFELLRKKLQSRSKLTSPRAALTLSTGRALPHSDDLGDISDTGQVGGTVPHLALEKEKDENPGTLLGNCSEHTKVVNVVVRSPDTKSNGSNINLDNVAKIKISKQESKISKWDRRKIKRTIQQLQKWQESKTISRCVLENLQKELMSTEDHLEPSPSQSAKPNEQQQAAVERSEQAALLSCQVSEGGLFWGGQDSSMAPSCDLPLPPNWKPTLSSWNDLEPQANFVSDPMDQSVPPIPVPMIEKLKEELKMRKLLRLPNSSVKKIFGHNAVLDSGATSSFIKPDGGAIPTGQQSSKTVRMPNGQTLNTSLKALLPNKLLNPKARECDILPGLQHSSLVSVGKLADAGYCTIFMPGNQGVQVLNGNNVKINVSGDAVLRGRKDPQGLWRVPMDDGNSVALSQHQLEESINNVFDLPSTAQTIRYLHACAGFPTRRTWIRAIKKGNFVGWPMVTVENVSKHFPESEETAKGHMNHQRQGVRSTKQKDFQEPDTSNKIGKKERDVYAKVVDLLDPKETIYTDQTGAFPVTAQSGARYIMGMVTIDGNTVLVSIIKNKSDQ